LFLGEAQAGDRGVKDPLLLPTEYIRASAVRFNNAVKLVFFRKLGLGMLGLRFNCELNAGEAEVACTVLEGLPGGDIIFLSTVLFKRAFTFQFLRLDRNRPVACLGMLTICP
jgi:hypothetical protein